MYDILEAETIAAYSLGQRRGFAVGVLCGAAGVIFLQKYALASLRARTNRPRPTTNYASPGRF